MSLLDRPFATRTILISSRDEAVREAAEGALAAAGFRTITAADGAETLDRMGRESPDLVVLDFDRSNKTGLRTCRELREIGSGYPLPVLVLTGDKDGESTERILEAGATDVAPRSIKAPHLVHRVRQLLQLAEALADLRVSEERLETVQRTARLGSWEYDPARGGFTLSGQAALLLGLPGEERIVPLESILGRVHPDDRTGVADAFERAILEGEPFSTDHRISTTDPKPRFLHAHAEVEDHAAPSPHRLRGTFQDITERKTDWQRIRYLAFFDILTGLPNRVQFRMHLKTALESARRREGLVAVLFLDLDHFKKINDSLGHDAGDTLLKEVATRLREAVRSSDSIGRSTLPPLEGIVARLGGDEFILALSGLAKAGDAARIAVRVLELLKNPYVIASKEISVSASIGISVYPPDGADVESLLKNADTALYHAKDSGRNNFQFYSPELNSSALERLSLELSLRRALDTGQFVLHYQPQVNPRDGAIVGAEALIRWNHPDLGVVPPAQFIPISEEIGLIRGIGDWVIREACRQARDWQQKGLGAPRIAVNVSPIQFKSADFAGQVIEIVRSHGLQPAQIEIELTEGLLMEPDSQAVETLRLLKAEGFRLSLDDFGTGYSSLAYLKRFSIDTLKIDRSFIQGLGENANDKAIVASFLALASGLGISTVAEGVENAFQRDYLLEYGCDIMQGYLFGRPVCAEEFEDLLRRFDPLTGSPVSRLLPSEVEELIESQEPIIA